VGIAALQMHERQLKWLAKRVAWNFVAERLATLAFKARLHIGWKTVARAERHFYANLLSLHVIEPTAPAEKS
jgi:hypothetical protein